MMAVQPASAAATGAVGSFVRQCGQRKIRPSGSSTSCETRPHDMFGHLVLTVILNPLLPPCQRFRPTSCCAYLHTSSALTSPLIILRRSVAFTPRAGLQPTSPIRPLWRWDGWSDRAGPQRRAIPSILSIAITCGLRFANPSRHKRSRPGPRDAGIHSISRKVYRDRFGGNPSRRQLPYRIGESSSPLLRHGVSRAGEPSSEPPRFRLLGQSRPVPPCGGLDRVDQERRDRLPGRVTAGWARSRGWLVGLIETCDDDVHPG
jgi:hypothetical protein